MSYHIIDMASDPRCGQFAYFRQMDFPFAGITAEIDNLSIPINSNNLRLKVC